MFAGQSGAEAALWRGRPGAALADVREALAGLDAPAPPRTWARSCWPRSGWPRRPTWRSAAGGGRSRRRRRGAAAGSLVVSRARRAADGLPRGGTLGPEGRAWLCRARPS